MPQAVARRRVLTVALKHQALSPSIRASPSSDAPAPRAPQPDRGILSHVSHVLHLLHHRNKNQHRRSVWYKWFSLLRRHVSKLLVDQSELEALNAIPVVALSKASRAASKKLERESAGNVPAGVDARAAILDLNQRIAKREAYLKQILLPESWLSFSNLVAEKPFVQLGVVLIGCLGELGTVLGSQVRGENDGIGVGHDLSGKRGLGMVVAEGNIALARQRDEYVDVMGLEDFGEVVGREDSETLTALKDNLDKLPTDHKGQVEETKPQRTRRIDIDRDRLVGRKSSRKTKGKRKVNTIDELFSGLV